MKINKKETFTIEMEKEELLVLLEIFGQMKIDKQTSSSLALKIVERFQQFRTQLLGEALNEDFSDVESHEDNQQKLKCDGCDIDQDVSIVHCPATFEDIPLCNVCYLKRKHLGVKK